MKNVITYVGIDAHEKDLVHRDAEGAREMR